MVKLLGKLLEDWTGHDTVAALIVIAHVASLLVSQFAGKGEPSQLEALGLAAFGYLFRGAVSAVQTKMNAATAVMAKADVPP